MKQILFFLCLCIGINFASAQNLPDNPDPGKCYVKCITKDEFKDVQETIQVYPAYTTLEVIPATYRTVEEQVLVREASKKYTYIPAVYENVEVSYIKKDGRTDLAIVPATFGSASRTFEIYPKTSGWEYKQLDECDSPNKEDCMVACFVEYPAQFRDVSFTTLSNDASTSSVPVPERGATYKKRVIKEP